MMQTLLTQFLRALNSKARISAARASSFRIASNHLTVYQSENEFLTEFFTGVDLSGADLRGTRLRARSLRGDLRHADPPSADLRNSYLFGVNLCGSTLSGTSTRLV
jgi:uncharacterized protein YjbI with pentapeptide repeats